MYIFASEEKRQHFDIKYIFSIHVVLGQDNFPLGPRLLALRESCLFSSRVGSPDSGLIRQQKYKHVLYIRYDSTVNCRVVIRLIADRICYS